MPPSLGSTHHSPPIPSYASLPHYSPSISISLSIYSQNSPSPSLPLPPLFPLPMLPSFNLAPPSFTSKPAHLKANLNSNQDDDDLLEQERMHLAQPLAKNLNHGGRNPASRATIE